MVIKVGSDLDGVYFNTIPLYIERGNFLAGTKYDITDIEEYDLTKLSGWDETISGRVFRDIHKVGNYPMMPGAHFLKILLNLRQFCHIPYFVTSRSRDYYHVTDRELQKQWGNNFILSGFSTPKAEVIWESHIDYFVEDNPADISDIIETTDCHVFVFDYPYNRYISGNQSGYTRVCSWFDIFMKIVERELS